MAGQQFDPEWQQLSLRQAAAWNRMTLVHALQQPAWSGRLLYPPQREIETGERKQKITGKEGYEKRKTVRNRIKKVRIKANP